MTETQFRMVPVEYDPFKGKAIEKSVPATDTQVGIWAACKIGGDPATRAFTTIVTLEMAGALDMDMLGAALQQVVARHDALRSVYSADGKMLIVFKEVDVHIFYEDISGNSLQQRYDAYQLAVAESANAFLQPGHVPLFRFSLFRMSGDVHRLMVCVHQIICDNWSLSTLLQETSVIYNALYAGKPNMGLAAAPSFASYSASLFQQKGKEASQEVQTFWEQQFSTGRPNMNSAAAPTQQVAAFYQSNRNKYTLPEQFTQLLRKMAKQAGCSFFTAFFAAIEICFQKEYTEGIVLGVVSAGQPANGNAGLVGCCSSIIPLKSQFQGNLTFQQYLLLRRTELLKALDHREVALTELLSFLKPERNGLRVPLVPLVVRWSTAMDKQVYFNGIKHQLVLEHTGFDYFELLIDIHGDENGLAIEWHYNTSLYTSVVIDERMQQLEAFLYNVVAHPDDSIAQQVPEKKISASTAIFAGRTPVVPFDRNYTVVQMFAAVARRDGEKTALMYQDRSISYKLLNDKSDRIAALLISMGVKANDVVALLLHRSPDLVVTMLAILKTGAALLPMDAADPLSRQHHILADSRCKVIFTSAALNQEWPEGVQVILQEDAWKRSLDFKHTELPALHGALPAKISYTSGDMMHPYGVVATHCNLTNLSLASQKQPGYQDTDRFLAIAPVSGDLAVNEILLPLAMGATVVLAEDGVATDMKLVAELIKKQQVTVVHGTAETWNAILTQTSERFPTVKAVCTGSALNQDKTILLQSRFAALWTVYGPPEALSYATIKKVEKGEPVSIGKPIQNMHVYLLDELGKPVQVGKEGYMYLGGEGITTGYLHHPESIASWFLADPFGKPGAFMYRTGDTGKLTHGGDIVQTTRSQDRLAIGGHLLEVLALEEMIGRQNGVDEAAITIADGQLTVLFASEAKDNAPIVSTIQKTLRDILPICLLPAAIERITSLPRTVQGKLNRNALPAWQKGFKQPAADSGLPGEVEKMVMAIWKEVLGIDQISMDDDFFKIGGDSLKAIGCISRLVKKTGKPLQFSMALTHTTARSMADAIKRGHTAQGQAAIVPLKPSGQEPPLFIIPGLQPGVAAFAAVAKHMGQDQPVFGLAPKKLMEPDAPLMTVENIAAFYINEILTSSNLHTLALAGHSFGAYIAFEMAKQLRAMGKNVKIVALIDGYALDEKDKESSGLQLKRKLLQQLPKMSFIPGLGTRADEDPSKGSTLRSRFSELFGGVGSELSAEDRKLYSQYEHAFQQYVLEPFDGVLDVFRVGGAFSFTDDTRYLGWKPLAIRGIRVHPIPGDRSTFMVVPNNKEFAAALQAALDQVKIS